MPSGLGGLLPPKGTAYAGKAVFRTFSPRRKGALESGGGTAPGPPGSSPLFGCEESRVSPVSGNVPPTVYTLPPGGAKGQGYFHRARAVYFPPNITLTSAAGSSIFPAFHKEGTAMPAQCAAEVYDVRSCENRRKTIPRQRG